MLYHLDDFIALTNAASFPGCNSNCDYMCSSSYSLCIHTNLNMQRHFEGKWLHPNRITESKQFCILKGEVLFKHASLQHNFAHNSGNKLKGSLDMYRYDCSKKSSHKHSIHVYMQAIQL